MERDRGDLLYTIYAGGDDLFIVGAWDRLPALADAIRSDFAAYCGQNPVMHLSAGIAIDVARFPIYQLAQRAAEALDAAKSVKGPPARGDKNAISLLGHLVPWESFESVRSLVEQLTPPERVTEPSALFSRLHDIAALDREERSRHGIGPPEPLRPEIAMVGRAKWRGLVALRRAIEQYQGSDREFARFLAEIEEQLISDRLTPHLPLAVRWADYLWRVSNTGEE
jgi:CRISPR-associated protein Csm1